MSKVLSRYSPFYFPVAMLLAVGSVCFLQWNRPFTSLSFIRGTHSQTVVFSDTIMVRFVMYNRSSKEVEITAIEKNCDCATFGPLPCIAQPFAEIEVPVRLNASRMTLPVTRQFYFHTNPPQPGLVGQVTIIPKPAEN